MHLNSFHQKIEIRATGMYIDSEKNIKKYFLTKTFYKGKAYYYGDRVKDISLENSQEGIIISAKVDGSQREPYRQ